MSFPLKQRFVTSGFRTPQRPDHNGVDYRANYVSLYAPFDGIITRQGNQPGLAGEYIIFVPDYDKTIEIRLYHLSKRLASNHVRLGTLIATTGSTGHSLAPHLHLEVHRNGQPIDPELFNWNTMKIKILGHVSSMPPVAEAQAYFGEDGVTLDFDYESIYDTLEFETITMPGLSFKSVIVTPLEKYRKGADIIMLWHGSGEAFGNVRPNSQGTFAQMPCFYQPVAEFFVHELLHALCYKTGVKDIVHQLGYQDPRPGTTYHVLIQQLKPFLTGAPTPKTMTKEEVIALQALEGYSDPVGAMYWVGKNLSAYLKARLTDKIKQEQLALAPLQD